MKRDEVIFGTRAVIETINSGREIEKVFVQKDISNDQVKELFHLSRSLRIPTLKVPKEKLNRITRKNHQGVIAFTSAINYASLDNVLSSVFEKGKEPFILILDRITDVRNFGAIARTAECAGADAILIPTKESAQINSDAVKTSAGALNHIAVCRTENLKSELHFLKESGLNIVGCTEKASESIYGSELNGPIGLVMGSEENGISTEILKACHSLIAIPQLGKISSLNVSVAAGISMFEVVRQRSLQK